MVVAYDRTLKIVLYGHDQVGKTALLRSFAHDKFENEEYIPTIAVDVCICFARVPPIGKLVRIVVWDTAGRPRFRNIADAHAESAHCILFCYDISNRKTFQDVCERAQQISETNRQATVSLVGLKRNLRGFCEDDVTTGEGIKMADRLSAITEREVAFFELSSNRGEIHQCFSALAIRCCHQLETVEAEASDANAHMKTWRQGINGSLQPQGRNGSLQPQGRTGCSIC